MKKNKARDDAKKLISKMADLERALGVGGPFDFAKIKAYAEELKGQSGHWLGQVALCNRQGVEEWAAALHAPWLHVLPDGESWHIEAGAFLPEKSLGLWLEQCVGRWLVSESGDASEAWGRALGAVLARDGLDPEAKGLAMKMAADLVDMRKSDASRYFEKASACLEAMAWHGAGKKAFGEVLAQSISAAKKKGLGLQEVLVSRAATSLAEAYQARGVEMGRGCAELRARLQNRFGQPAISSDSDALEKLDECALAWAECFQNGKDSEPWDYPWEARAFAACSAFGQRPKLAQAVARVCQGAWGSLLWHPPEKWVGSASSVMPFFTKQNMAEQALGDSGLLGLIGWTAGLSPLHSALMLGNAQAAKELSKAGFGFDAKEAYDLLGRLVHKKDLLLIGFQGMASVDDALALSVSALRWLDLDESTPGSQAQQKNKRIQL